MTTKNNFLSSSDKKRQVIDSNFSNFTLNQNHKHLSGLSSTSNFADQQRRFAINKTTEEIHKLPQSSDHLKDSDPSKVYNSWNKISARKLLPLSSYKTFNRPKSVENNQNLETSGSKSSSTLSLHIAAYENTIKALEKKGKERALRKTKKPALVQTRITDFFQFSRQQETEATKPEMMQFKASQKLFIPNEIFADRDAISHSPTVEKPAETDKEDPSTTDETFYGNPAPPGTNPYISELEDLYILNCKKVLEIIIPHSMASYDFSTLLQESFQFPTLARICEKLNKLPRMIFEQVEGIEIQQAGFGNMWLSLLSNQPALRRKKLDYPELISYFDGPPRHELYGYVKPSQEYDAEFFKKFPPPRLTEMEKSLNDMHFDDEYAKSNAALLKALQKVGPPEILQQKVQQEEGDESEEDEIWPVGSWHSTTEDPMKPFHLIFNVDRLHLFPSKSPPETSFVRDEMAMAKFFPSDKKLYGCVLERDPQHFFLYQHIVSILEEQNITELNEFQRLIAYLVQLPFDILEKKSNLLICAEPFRGIKTALTAGLFKLVAKYKDLDEYGVAPIELRGNKDPYVLVIGLKDVNSFLIAKAFQSFLVEGVDISMPNSFCTNVKFQQNLSRGCDILVIDGKKIDLIRQGVISLSKLRHVVFLDVERFCTQHSRIISDVHELIQANQEEMRFVAKESGESESNVDVQYIFQSSESFLCWDAFSHLFQITQPVCDNLALVLDYDYRTYQS